MKECMNECRLLFECLDGIKNKTQKCSKGVEGNISDLNPTPSPSLRFKKSSDFPTVSSLFYEDKQPNKDI